MKKTRFIILLASLGLALSACGEASLPYSSEYSEEELNNLGGEISTPWVDYSVPATSVIFPDVDKVVNLNKGETHTYNPTISPKAANISALTFTSQDTSVASVSEGVLTANGGGSTNIVVSSKENSFTPISLEVNVTVPVTDIIVSKTSLDLGYGYTEQLSVTYVPADTTQLEVTYFSNSDVVTVSEDGLVTAGNVDGTATISVISPYLPTSKEVSVTVTDKVIHVENVKINTAQTSVEVDKSFALNATVVPENADDKGLIYTSSNENVATVSEDGIVTAIDKGSTKITVTAHENSDKKIEKDITVYEIVADDIIVPDTVNMVINATEQLRPTYQFNGENVTPSRINTKYESSDATVATVNASGLLTAKGLGTATITVTEGLLSKNITVNVNEDIVTYNVFGFENWTPNDGSDVFAWVWGTDSSYPGVWIKVTLSYEGEPDSNNYSDVTGTFDGPRNITGVVFVRCKNGTVTPDWEEVEDGDGRIYNKTEDISISGTSIYVTEWKEYPEVPDVEGYGIKFVGGASYVGVDAGTDVQARPQYSLEAIHFPEGARFTIYNFGTKTGWVENIEGYSFGGENGESENWKSYVEISDEEYIALVEFTADIFLKIAYENNSIYFGLVDDVDVNDSYAVRVGDVTTQLVAEDPTREGELQQYHASHLALSANNSITFYRNNVAITSNIGPDADNTTDEEYNNYIGSASSILIVQAENLDADIYLHLYEDGMSFWISGGNSGDHDLDVPTEGFGLMFENGDYYVGTGPDEVKYDEITYQQYFIENAYFEVNEQFKLFDFGNNAGWVVDIDEASFGETF